MPEASAFWITAPGEGALRREILRPPGPDEVLVETSFSGVSRGTERLVYQGRVPASQRQAMRAPFQAGEFPFPVKYGYSSVGVVVEGGEALRGRRVFCLYPHQDRYVVPAAAVLPLPARVGVRPVRSPRRSRHCASSGATSNAAGSRSFGPSAAGPPSSSHAR